MPSARRGRRTEINLWRVKVGKKAGEVFSSSEGDCGQWVREHQKDYRVKLRVIPPNA